MEKEKIYFIHSISNVMFGFGFSKEVSDFIGCQFALESDFGKSKLAKEHNNYCGMKFPLVRINVCSRISQSNVFAHYDCIRDCFIDYVLCLQYHKPLRKEIEDLSLFKFFIKWYCPEKDYINKITNLFNLYQNGKEK